MRVLGVVRLSRETDESTSPERQREAVSKWADLHGHTVIGWATDLDVSGDLDPWKRPKLGPWLTDRADEFDVIAAWKVDRISRRLLHFVSLVEWANGRGKAVASATEPINTSDRFGRMIAQILAMFAEFERDAIRERIIGGRESLREEGRWGGGHPPYGYRPVKVDGGWKLEPDPETVPVVREMVSRVIGGASVLSVCRSLNDRAVYTRQGAEWSAHSAFRVLRSPAMLGHAVHRREVVRDSDGLPLVVAEPIVSYEDWRQLQKVMDDRARGEKVRTHGAALLLGVGFCECGRRLYRQSGVTKGKVYAYYACSSRSRGKRTEDAATPEDKGKCKNKLIRAGHVDEVAEDAFLAIAGPVEFMEKRFVPGENHSAEVAQIEQALADLEEQMVSGVFTGDRGKADFARMYSRLNQKREALEAAPNVPDRWDDVPTGQTYRDVWQSLETVEARRAFLLASGFRVTVHAEPRPTAAAMMPEFAVPGDQLETRVSFEIPPDLQQRVREYAARL
jgi:site-specific DNA recombinase